MKRFVFPCFCLLLSLTGCSTLILPRYIPDKNPTTRNFYADYDAVVAATREAFKKFGWEVAQEADPAVFERAWQLKSKDVKQVLLMSNYRKSNYLIVSKHSALNAYIRSGKDATELDLRYLKVSTFPFKSFYKYRNKKLINRLLKQIEANLHE